MQEKPTIMIRMGASRGQKLTIEDADKVIWEIAEKFKDDKIFIRAFGLNFTSSPGWKIIRDNLRPEWRQYDKGQLKSELIKEFAGLIIISKIHRVLDVNEFNLIAEKLIRDYERTDKHNEVMRALSYDRLEFRVYAKKLYQKYEQEASQKVDQSASKTSEGIQQSGTDATSRAISDGVLIARTKGLKTPGPIPDQMMNKWFPKIEKFSNDRTKYGKRKLSENYKKKRDVIRHEIARKLRSKHPWKNSHTSTHLPPLI